MSRSDRLKIAVSGFVGTGKTSLCTALAKQLDLELIPEDVGDIVKAEEHVRRAGFDAQHGSPESLLAAKETLAQLYPIWAADRSGRIMSNRRLVADRWHLDLLIWWMLSFRGARGGAENWTGALHKEMGQVLEQLDLLVVTPLIQPFAVAGSNNVDGLMRTGNFTDHLLFQSLLRGLLPLAHNTPIVVLPAKPMTIEERLGHVVDALPR